MEHSTKTAQYLWECAFSFKETFLTTIVKKPGLNVTDICTYLPISNLSVLSKLLQRLCTRWFGDYLTSTDLLPTLQSGFRQGHSTKPSCEYCLTSCRRSTMVIQLHWSSWTYQQHSTRSTLRFCKLLSASTTQFNGGFSCICMVEHNMYGAGSLIVNNSSNVWCASRVSAGPLLFIFYTANLMSLIKDNGFSPHLHADDMQVYGSCRPVEVDAFSAKLSKCTPVVSSWMQSN